MRHVRTLVMVAAAVFCVTPLAPAQSVSFSRLRAIGDSLTINTQGGMVSDYRTQVKGWVKLLANQIGTEMRLPLLEQMNLIGQQRRQDYPDYQHCHCYAYNGVSTDDTFSKTASEIPWYQFGWAWEHLDLVLADRPGYSLLSAAASDNPTFVVGFLGSNDFMSRVMARGTMMEGIPTLGLMDEIDPLDAEGLRPQDLFRSDFETVVTTLYKSGVGMCFGTLPTLPDIPGILTKAELTAFLGPNSLPDDCFTNYTVAAGVRGGLKGPEIFADDRNYYTPAELQTINDAILGYNATTRAAGANPAHPFAVVETPIQNPETITGSLHVNGWRINNQIFTDNLGKPRASIMTTDGVHMSDIGNAFCAQAYIRAINAYYGTAIPELTEAQLTSILNSDNFVDNDGDGRMEGMSCNVFFLTLNFVYPNETGDSNEIPRNAKILTTQVTPPASGHIAFTGPPYEGPEYFEGTAVTMTAQSDGGPDVIFSHWTGDVSGGSSTANPISVAMDTDKNITAVFDTAAPSITCLPEQNLHTDPGAAYATAADWRPEALVSDDCSAPEQIVVTQTPPPGAHLDVSASPHTVTLAAQDQVGKVTQCTFMVAVMDAESPTIACPADTSVNTDSGENYSAARDWTGEAVASDNVSPAWTIVLTQAPPPGAQLHAVDSPHTVTLTAQDQAGNASQCTFAVDVKDGEAPSIICPADATLGTVPNESYCIALDWTAEVLASDNVSAPGELLLTQAPLPGAHLDTAESPHTVTFTAEDEAGNTSECAFTVTVSAVTLPATGPLGLVLLIAVIAAGGLRYGRLDFR